MISRRQIIESQQELNRRALLFSNEQENGENFYQLDQSLGSKIPKATSEQVSGISRVSGKTAGADVMNAKRKTTAPGNRFKHLQQQRANHNNNYGKNYSKNNEHAGRHEEEEEEEEDYSKMSDFTTKSQINKSNNLFNQTQQSHSGAGRVATSALLSRRVEKKGIRSSKKHNEVSQDISSTPSVSASSSSASLSAMPAIESSKTRRAGERRQKEEEEDEDEGEEEDDDNEEIELQDYRHFDPYSVYGEEDEEEDVWYSEERLFEVSSSFHDFILAEKAAHLWE